MDVLVDTQALLWFEGADSRLSKKAKEAISDPKNEKFISVASFWEIAIKLSIGKPELKMSFDELTSLIGYHHLAIEVSHTRKVIGLPTHHRDPFDRLLIAQAIDEKMSIVSADTQFDAYGVKRIW